VYDVREYGAATGRANAAANTAAFAAAVAAIRAANGGVLYIPANADSSDTLWDLETPVWAGVSDLCVTGEGSWATHLRSVGPAFITLPHPKEWKCGVTSYVDADTSQTITTCENGILVNRDRYREDLLDFMSGGTFPPGAQDPLALIMSPGTSFAIRSRGGVVGARWPYCPLATGDNYGQANATRQWRQHSKITWQFLVYHHQGHASLSGGIAGSGGNLAPDPWLLSGTGGQYFFDLALTDADGIKRTFVEYQFQQNATVGLHRIAIQFDPSAVSDDDKLVVWVDKTRVAVTVRNFSDFNSNYHALNTSNSTVDLTNLYTVFNRVAHWCGSDFSVCCDGDKVGSTTSAMGGARSDYSVLLVSAHAAQKFTVGAIGSPQTKLEGGAADDSSLWWYTLSNRTDETAVGWMCNTYSWAASNTDLDINLMCYGKGWSPCWGYLHPLAAGDAIAQTISRPAFRGFSFRGTDNFQNSCGLLLGAYVWLVMDDLRHVEGGYASIGSIRNRVCYMARMDNLRLAKMIHLSDTSATAINWTFGYAKNCCILLTGSELMLTNFYGLDFDAWATGIIRCHAGSSLGAGLTLRTGNFNIEGVGITTPSGPAIYMQKAYNHPNNKLVVEDVSFGEGACQGIYLDDTMPSSVTPVRIDVKRTSFGNGNTLLSVVGKEHFGTIEVDQYVYLNDVNAFSPSIGAGVSIAQTPGVKTIDRSSYGIPPCGAFVAGMHEVEVRNPPAGGVAVWRVAESGIEGSGAPPTWVPLRMADSAGSQLALSASMRPSLYAECVIPWPVGGDTSLEITSLSRNFAKQTLATLLNGAAAQNRTNTSLRWGAAYVSHLYSGTVAGTFFSADSILNSSFWNAATNRAKTNTASFSITGNNAPAWEVAVRRRWSFALQLGADTGTAAIVGRTNRIEPADWRGMTGTYSVGAGQLALRMSDRPGGWTTYAANKILDYVGGGTISLPANFYVGLSTTAMSLGDSPVEPCDRVAVPRTSEFWSETGDSGYVWSNAEPITFETPATDWDVIRSVFIADALTGGNVLAVLPLNRVLRVFAGDSAPSFAPGALQICL
jgi:hypothetical protein